MTLELKNIGMIKEANVKIDGLTIIAGENDTGKSTIGKVLYSIIKTASTEYSHGVFQAQTIIETIENIFTYNFLNIKPIAYMKLITSKYVYSYINEKGYPESSTNTLYNWIWSGEGIENKNIIFIESPLIWNFTDFFRDIAQIESQMRIELDYPYLMKDLNFKLHIKNAFNGLNIKEKVTKLMGGEFKKDEMGRYYFDKQGQRIELVNTATGIKYFGIFQVLSQNNYLNENTVLVLDEPEVHLHPKWQLEMAKIIVELVKNGIKIVVNSHSPYMIEALELYSSKQKINNNFYLAEKTDDYAIISDVTDNLEPIYSKLAKPIQDLEEESLENFKW